MRIVMLSDDAEFLDRRILLQGEDLAGLGHEVILLARSTPKTPRFRRVGRIKVHHIPDYPPSVSRPRWRDFLVAGTRVAGRTAKKVVPGGLHIVQRALAAAPRIATNFDYYLQRETSRLSDPWIPVHRKLKIAATFSALLVGGGAMAIVRSVHRRLRRVGRQVHAKSFLDKPLQPTQWDKTLIHHGIYYDPDVIVAHDLPQLFAGAEIKRRLRIPLVYDAHEAYASIGSLTPAEQRFLAARERAFVGQCDVRMTVNPFIATHLAKINKSAPFTVITNATSPPVGLDYSMRYRRFHERYGLRPETKVLLYQGWFSTEGRGLFELVDAMGHVDHDCVLVMLGYGDHDLFRKSAEAAGAASKFIAMDAVPGSELVFWSASADLGIIPTQPIDLNHRLCSPNKLFEWIAARLPMLANDLPYLREVIEGEGFGVVRPMGSSSEIAQAINEALDPAKDYLNRARAALAIKGPQWEWAAQTPHLLAAYASLPEPKRPAYAGAKARLARLDMITPPPVKTGAKPTLIHVNSKQAASG